MDDQRLASIGDHVVIHGSWERTTLDIFVEALERYLQKLDKDNLEGNTQINDEVGFVEWLIDHLETPDDMHRINISMSLDAEYYKLLSDVLHKYYTALHNDLSVKKRKTSTVGALEAEEKKVEEIRRILQLPTFVHIPRRKTLVQDLSLPELTAPHTVQDPIVKQQIDIQNMYGPAVFGINYGQVISNDNKELIDVLHNFAREIVNANELSDNIKREALADIQTIQAQLDKKNPIKSVVTGAAESLGMLANAVAVMTFGPTVKHYIEKIAELLKKINF
jgi:hypothetical protein